MASLNSPSPEVMVNEPEITFWPVHLPRENVSQSVPVTFMWIVSWLGVASITFESIGAHGLSLSTPAQFECAVPFSWKETEVEPVSL